MKNIPLLFLLGVLLTGCSTREMDTAASNTLRTVTYPVTAPLNALGKNPPISSQTSYTYWRKIPGTNSYEAYTSSKPLTAEEMESMGIRQTPEPPAPAN